MQQTQAAAQWLRLGCRYVLTWQLSNTLDGCFCLDAPRQAPSLGRPAIFNSDQSSQFTANDCTACLKQAAVRIPSIEEALAQALSARP